MEHPSTEQRVSDTSIDQPNGTPKPTEEGAKSPAKAKVVRKRNPKSANGSVTEALASEPGSAVPESPEITAQPADTDDAKPTKGAKAKSEKKPRTPKPSAKSSPEKIPKKRASKPRSEAVVKKRKKAESASEEPKPTSSDEPVVPLLQSAPNGPVENDNTSGTPILPSTEPEQQTTDTFVDQYANHGDIEHLLHGTSWSTNPADEGGSNTQCPMTLEQMRYRIIDLEDVNVALEMDKALLTMEKDNLLAKETLLLSSLYRIRQEHRQLRQQARSL